MLERMYKGAQNTSCLSLSLYVILSKGKHGEMSWSHSLILSLPVFFHVNVDSLAYTLQMSCFKTRKLVYRIYLVPHTLRSHEGTLCACLRDWLPVRVFLPVIADRHFLQTKARRKKMEAILAYNKSESTAGKHGGKCSYS